jgi:hypothetical protein
VRSRFGLRTHHSRHDWRLTDSCFASVCGSGSFRYECRLRYGMMPSAGAAASTTTRPTRGHGTSVVAFLLTAHRVVERGDDGL